MTRLNTQVISDFDPKKRKTLNYMMGATALTVGLGGRAAYASEKPPHMTPEFLLSQDGTPQDDAPLWGLAMSYGEKRLDLIDLDGSQILHSFEGFHANHAIIPVEALNRFIIHGARPGTRTGALMVLEVDPVLKSWTVLMDRDIKGGPLLHWQPRPDLSEVVFNTIGDGRLHVLDTKTLEITAYRGGGHHSNMAMMDDLLIATDEMAGPSNLLITDRKTNEVLSQTPVSTWGHGVSVNFKRGEAYVWAKDGMHRISLARKTMGQHLGLIPSLETGERSWFCWTPQGQQFSHDVSWNWDSERGDIYQPYITAVDMENARLERIATGSDDIQPSFLQVSPDGQWGLASLRGHDDIGIFDLKANVFKGTATAGPARASFFERDMAFCKNRDFALVTNTAENSVSLLNLKTREEARRIYLPRRPEWFKSLSA